jgi:glycosyltransferase involved in cell wall biosynthesis
MENLSICIPTFNRQYFLKYTLDKTIADFPKSKIIVSDNCSTDGTAAMDFPGRYIRQPTNIGAFPNMRAALLASHTTYCAFLGDDDYLVREEVEKGIAFMDEHPEVLVYYAPCQLWDEVNQKANWTAFYPADDQTFKRSDELWNFVMHKHVWPEHAIYRRERLEEIMQPRTSAYWCFVDLANAAVRGPVHFAKTPYYRNITHHPCGSRQKLGDQQCLTEFDSYTAGLQVLAHDIFGPALNEVKDLRHNINAMIRMFMWSRFEVASRILTANNRLVEAGVLQKRMAITGYADNKPSANGPPVEAPKL